MFKIDNHIKVCFKSYESLTLSQDVFIDQRFFFGCKHLINGWFKWHLCHRHVAQHSGKLRQTLDVMQA